MTLRKVSPALAVHDRADGRGRNAILSGELRSHAVVSVVRAGTNLGNLFGGEERTRMAGPARDRMIRAMGVPPLFAHVPIIGRVVTKEQVIGATARRIIAGVADQHARRDGSVRQLPGETMRPHRAAFAAFVGQIEQTIAILIARAVIFPALAVRLQACAEALGCGAFAFALLTPVRTATPGACRLEPVDSGARKRPTALLTGLLDWHRLGARHLNLLYRGEGVAMPGAVAHTAPRLPVGDSTRLRGRQ